MVPSSRSGDEFAARQPGQEEPGAGGHDQGEGHAPSHGGGGGGFIVGRLRGRADAVDGREGDRGRPTRSAAADPRKTQRQPMVSPTTPAIAGPMTPGSTQAVDSVANICGRNRSGRLRPMAT